MLFLATSFACEELWHDSPVVVVKYYIKKRAPVLSSLFDKFKVTVVEIAEQLAAAIAELVELVGFAVHLLQLVPEHFAAMPELAVPVAELAAAAEDLHCFEPVVQPAEPAELAG